MTHLQELMDFSWQTRTMIVCLLSEDTTIEGMKLSTISLASFIANGNRKIKETNSNANSKKIIPCFRSRQASPQLNLSPNLIPKLYSKTQHICFTNSIEKYRWKDKKR